MSLIDGAYFSRRRISLSEVLENTSVNWPLNSSAFSVSDSAKPLPFLLLRGGMPWLSFLWLLVYRWKSLMSQLNLLAYKSCCFSKYALISYLSSWNFWGFLAFAWVLFLFSNLPSNLRCNPRDGNYRPTCLRENILTTVSCMKKVIKLKLSWTEREPEWPLKYLSSAKFEESRLIESKSPFWYK